MQKTFQFLVVCKKTSFACGFASIERRTIFDLWQMSYAARSSLRSLRYASQKQEPGRILKEHFIEIDLQEKLRGTTTTNSYTTENNRCHRYKHCCVKTLCFASESKVQKILTDTPQQIDPKITGHHRFVDVEILSEVIESLCCADCNSEGINCKRNILRKNGLRHPFS